MPSHQKIQSDCSAEVSRAVDISMGSKINNGINMKWKRVSGCKAKAIILYCIRCGSRTKLLYAFVQNLTQWILDPV